MNAEEILDKYGLGAQPAHDEFIQQLRNLPKGAAKWLYSPAPPNVIVQGDVLGPVQYVAISEGNERALVESEVMLVSNTCDLVPTQQPFSLVAPVIELEAYTGTETTRGEPWISRLHALRKFEINPFYYLPGWIRFRESFADFSRITHLPSSYLVELFRRGTSVRKVSLSSKGYLLLLSKLTYFLARLETDEISRQSGSA